MSTTQPKTYLGKHRATVKNNKDPERRGRIQVECSDTGHNPSTWALPCAPVSGSGMGFFALPPVGSAVWIEFEKGNPDKPVWVGCFWGSAAEVPPMAQTESPATPGITLQTLAGNGVTISGKPGPSGGIQLKTSGGAMISITDVGITITNGQGAVISLKSKIVDINTGALTVQ